MKKQIGFIAILIGLVSLSQSIYADYVGGESEVNNKSSSHKPYHHTRGGDWFTRLRALYVLPNDSSGSLSTIPNSGVSVNPSWTGEFDFAYMFTKNFGAELILATCRNTLNGKKALSHTEIGKAWLLPPTLTLQWRFFPSALAQPYIGAGVNYTLFYGIDCSLADTHLHLKHSWGPALQAGIDIFVYKNFFVNADVKYIWMDTHARLSGATSGSVHVDVNPWLFGVGFGYKW